MYSTKGDDIMKTVGEFKKAGVVFVEGDRGDTVFTPAGQHGVIMLLPDTHGDTIVLERDVNYDSLKHYNPELEALKDIIGLHDDPTECAKAILAAGYKK